LGFLKQIDEFDDRPGGMTDGEERVRIDSSGRWRAASAAASGQSYGQNCTVSTWAAGA
jgi:hypothetical protein